MEEGDEDPNQDDEQKEEEMIDLNQLDNEEKYAILQYLEEEYDKNPD